MHQRKIVSLMAPGKPSHRPAEDDTASIGSTAGPVAKPAMRVRVTAHLSSRAKALRAPNDCQDFTPTRKFPDAVNCSWSLETRLNDNSHHHERSTLSSPPNPHKQPPKCLEVSAFAMSM